MNKNDEMWMRLALKEAQKARDMDEVPVGAVLLSGAGELLAVGHNAPITRCDPTAHAEMIALRRACRKIQNYRLLNAVLYVTLEPCVMCMGALIHARVARVVFGAPDPKWGAAGSLYHFAHDRRLNHAIEVEPGALQKDCAELIRGFFLEKRAKRSHECRTLS
jgi:tRNA(adenine34) deaminase